ncbi:patr class I histocompatibility antigen, B-1 alpha chain-like isoform X2 [Carassius gibelio]|uniref:patr class I histocompatibility antigen, B-1 alpha chain-like isoform X2 n=1 Tax=Carassius gibelio TaxID=101364 RepID=UPI0022787941|nr:patr class I histocompatibility antigen, B-1 alpha chain-like isoform X2 [Carassius gibelio]
MLIKYSTTFSEWNYFSGKINNAACCRLLFLLGAHLACARTHSMRYFYTGVSGISDFPEFTAVALVDDEQFMYFDSNTKKAVPKTEWIRQNEGEDYWNGETKIFTGTYPAFKINIQNLKKLFNQSAGVHTWQQMCGCELDDDGTKRGYWQYGFDGEDFLSLDKSTLTWTAASPQAVLTKHKWEVNRAIIEQQKAYLENTCIDWLQKYVRYGKETLERKGRNISCLYNHFISSTHRYSIYLFTRKQKSCIHQTVWLYVTVSPLLSLPLYSVCIHLLQN